MRATLITLCFLFFTALGQSQILISYNKSDNIDFAKYKTFHINSPDITDIPEFEPKQTGLNLLIDEIIKQMNARGYREVKEDPELIINLGIAISKKIQTRQTELRDAVYMGQRNYHWESENIVIRKYIEGSVTLDLVDNADNQMIWQAVSEGVLAKKREKNKKKIMKAVQKLFKKYPVKSVTN